MAPEILEKKYYDGTKADVFSLGVLLFTLVIGRFPFKRANDEDENWKQAKERGYVFIAKVQNYFKENHGKDLTPEFKELIMQMIDYDPVMRPSIS